MESRMLRLWALVSAALISCLAAANPVRYEHIEVELISEVTSVQPGTPFWVALRLQPAKGWHIYWRNPGDVGLPPKLTWQLPEGSTAGEIQWPYPEKFVLEENADYGYSGETLLPVRIQPPEILSTATPFTLRASAFWLACETTCVPGNAELNLTLPFSEATPPLDPRWQRAFESTRARLPATPDDWRSSFTMQDGSVYLRVETHEPVFEGAERIRLFPGEPEIIAGAAPQDVRWQPNRLDLRQPLHSLFGHLPEALSGVIVVDTADTTRAYNVTATPTLTAQPEAFDAAPQPVRGESRHLLLVILSAIAGGILLNLMPCVFPVLSLKAIGLLESAGLSHNLQRLHGIAYTLGAVVFFAMVAGVLILLRTSGASIGWGFQLQSPWFVALLAYLLFVMGLSFSGMMEFGAGFMGFGQNLTQRSGLIGSFFTGALAAVVASPCTAPFMGTAIAYAISQPAPVALSVFVALGFGMASPFLLISFMPALARALPRPGPWMNVLRQLMAFPLYLTVIWLLWVLGRQTDASGMAATLGGMLLLVFAIWVLKLRAHTRGRWRRMVEALTVLATLGAFAILHLPMLNEPAIPVRGEASADTKQRWEPYSAERLAQLRAERKAVFVNLTADWCISCIANERVALSFPSVRRALEDYGIVRMKGDWTSRDPEISKVLQTFGREGVPLYVIYPSDPQAEPMVLPQFLTPQIVLNALAIATGNRPTSTQDLTSLELSMNPPPP